MGMGEYLRSGCWEGLDFPVEFIIYLFEADSEFRFCFSSV